MPRSVGQRVCLTVQPFGEFGRAFGAEPRYRLERRLEWCRPRAPEPARVRLAVVFTNHRDVAGAFRVTLDLFETGVALMRQNLRRQDPSATEEEIDQRLVAWLHHRQGAALGDGVGQPPARPRWS